MPSEEQVLFYNKLGEIPVLNDGWLTAADYYSRVKDYNALMRMTFSVAESGVKVAGKISSPVLNHYQPQLNNVNEYACKKLDELETMYPSIKQPTEQWKETCNEFVQPVVGRVKPVVSQVQGIVDNGKKTINGIKTASTNMLEGAKNRGVGTVTYVVDKTFQTTPGRFVTRNVDKALDITENFVDKYLPEEKEEEDQAENENKQAEDSDDTSSGSDKVEEMEVMNPTPTRVLVHAGCITGKVRRRMYRRAMDDLTYARTRASSALKRMNKTVELMDYAKKNLNTAKDKVDHMYTEIVKEQDPADEKSLFAGSVEERIVVLGRLAARQVRTGVLQLEKASSELGEFCLNPISKSKEYKELIQTFLTVESIQNLSSQTLERARESLKHLQDRIKSTVNHYKPNWERIYEPFRITLDDGEIVELRLRRPVWVSCVSLLLYGLLRGLSTEQAYETYSRRLADAAIDINMEDIPLQESDIGMEQVMSQNNNSETEIEREENR